MTVAPKPEAQSLIRALKGALESARARPAFGLYLLALATLGWKWLSPLSSFYERAIWSDGLIAAAAAAWLWERVRANSLPRPRKFHLALAAYFATAVLSLAFAEAAATAARNVVLIGELAVLAALTSAFASDRRGREAIVVVIALVALFTAALAAVGLALFYAGVDTSLVGRYGDLLPSNRYARLAAGFESTQLLASFCIFASAIVSHEDSPLSRRFRRLTQLALLLLVISTFSRGIVAFLAAGAIRVAHARLRPARARMAAIAAVLAALAVVAALTVGQLRLEPTRPTSASYDLSYSGGRRAGIAAAARTFADHPLVGKGPGSRVVPGSDRAHLTPVNVAATMGAPALIALCILVGLLWQERRRPTPIATWSGLIGLAIDGLSVDIEHFRHVWVLLGFADAERRVGGDSDGISPTA